MPGPEHFIIVGVDGSPSSLAALRWAASQAEMTGARLDAVIAWHYPIAAGGLGLAPSQGLDDTDYAGLAADSLSTAVAQVGELPGDLKIRQLVTVGEAAQALLRAAKGADLLVVGSRGHGTFAEALLGSVSNRCVHHADCPVVVVRPGDQGKQAQRAG